MFCVGSGIYMRELRYRFFNVLCWLRDIYEGAPL